MNAVIAAVICLLVLTLKRINIVFALTCSALLGGILSGLSLPEAVKVFESGLGGGATIALSYAMLGALAVAISQSGLTNVLISILLKRWHGSAQGALKLKYILLTALLLCSICSQNLIPIHIAFIPILLPPLLKIFNQLQLDRRLVACCLTFGLVMPYLILPVGFGGIFLKHILLTNLTENGLSHVTLKQVTTAMLWPAGGMFAGLSIAVFFSYRQPRDYASQAPQQQTEAIQQQPDQKVLGKALVAILVALVIQMWTDSMVVGALFGFAIFSLTGIISLRNAQGIFDQGVQMMAMVGFIMIAAAGFSAVMKETGAIDTLVKGTTCLIGDHRALLALLMLLAGLFVTMGIGSSFSTVPIITSIYVPLAQQFGFSDLATIVLVGTAAALGDAGSPASDSTLGPTAGLNVDGQHDHIWDTVVPTFLHYNIPLIIFGWVGAMFL